MGELKAGMRNIENKMKDLDDKVQVLERQVKNLKADKDRLEMRYEMKLRELQLRVRGLEEKEEENVRYKVINVVAELLELNPEEIDKRLDYVFRLQSPYVNKEKIPRDIIVNVTSKQLKDQIIQQSLQNPIEYKGRKVMILRELPR